MYLQSIKTVKHNAANSVNRSILKKSRLLGFGVFIVHSSMTELYKLFRLKGTSAGRLASLFEHDIQELTQAVLNMADTEDKIIFIQVKVN
jgi:hypothetical protein